MVTANTSVLPAYELGIQEQPASSCQELDVQKQDSENGVAERQSTEILDQVQPIESVSQARGQAIEASL
ncbi:hypothetical protein V6N12_000106 [Hibiscus sabdariffa]|uniref:Uncharacterized protein n=1 Tax=Hibiscus sabdariffa TaxID=183260 RepID=A0ABR2AZB4_9ROSI